MPKTKNKVARDVLVPITIKVPLSLLNALDATVETEDTDRSKFARRAIKDRLARFGFEISSQAS